jgi:hypothetical protein
MKLILHSSLVIRTANTHRFVRHFFLVGSALVNQTDPTIREFQISTKDSHELLSVEPIPLVKAKFTGRNVEWPEEVKLWLLDRVNWITFAKTEREL